METPNKISVTVQCARCSNHITLSPKETDIYISIDESWEWKGWHDLCGKKGHMFICPICHAAFIEYCKKMRDCEELFYTGEEYLKEV